MLENLKAQEPAIKGDIFQEIQQFDLSTISFETKKSTPRATNTKQQPTGNVANKVTAAQPSQTTTTARVPKVLQATTKPVSQKSPIKTPTTTTATKSIQPSKQATKQNPTQATPKTSSQTSTAVKSTQTSSIAQTPIQSEGQPKTVLDRGKILDFLEMHLKKQIASAVEKAQV